MWLSLIHQHSFVVKHDIPTVAQIFTQRYGSDLKHKLKLELQKIEYRISLNSCGPQQKYGAITRIKTKEYFKKGKRWKGMYTYW
jgi:hypothetical protein